MTRKPDKQPLKADRHLSISPVPVKELGTFEADWPSSHNDLAPCAHGAQISFEGIVRGMENGIQIAGITYSAYLPMAEAEIARIEQEGLDRFGKHPLFIHHSLGFVADGEASIIIRVRLPHSKEAFAACQWYLAAVKTRVPIWKNPIAL